MKINNQQHNTNICFLQNKITKLEIQRMQISNPENVKTIEVLRLGVFV